jgi:anti-sigma factor RsiW
MEADNALLMAYIDGELDVSERQEVEKRIQESPEVARRVAQLQASRQVSRDAFARQQLPPVPDSLARSVAALAQAHRERAANEDPARAAPDRPEAVRSAAATATATAAAGSAATAATPAGPAARRSARGDGWRPSWGWLVGAFVAGAACAGVVMQVGPALGVLPGTGAGTAPRAAVAMGSAPWVRQAADYVALYTRATLAHTEASLPLTAKTVADIAREDGLSLRIPDLSQAGLAFKEVQRLRFNGKPLVQIMYLPAQGDPVALCVLPEPKPDQAVSEQRVERMNVVTWRQSELGYALIGAPEGLDLRAVGASIAERRVQALPLERS